jgi:hypothetical protein
LTQTDAGGYQLWILNRDKSLYRDDPDVWRPETWAWD